MIFSEVCYVCTLNLRLREYITFTINYFSMYKEHTKLYKFGDMQT